MVKEQGSKCDNRVLLSDALAVRSVPACRWLDALFELSGPCGGKTLKRL